METFSFSFKLQEYKEKNLENVYHLPTYGKMRS